MAKRVVIGVALLLAAALAFAIVRFNLSDPTRDLSSQTRADFVRSAMEACTARQKASPGNADLPQKTIDGFCGCYAESLARRVSAEDVSRLASSKPDEIQTAMREKMVEAEGVCLDRLDDDAEDEPKP